MNQTPDPSPEDELWPAPHPDEPEELPAPQAEEGAPEPEPHPVTDEMRPSGEPPQVVAETPVGGLRPPVPGQPRPLDETAPAVTEPEETADEASAEETAAEPSAADETLRLTAEHLPDSRPAEAVQALPLPEIAPELAELPAAALAATEGEAPSGLDERIAPMPDAESAPPDALVAPAQAAVERMEEGAAPSGEAEIAPGTLVAPEPARSEPEVPSEETPVSLVNAALAAVTGAAEPEAPPSALGAAAEEKIASPEEWEEDLSPELAAVLFGSPRKAAVTAPPVTEPAVEPAAAPAVAARAEPVALISEEQAQTLPLSAGGHRAPAPEVGLAGKVRYTRIEEPLPGDRGQHIVETWVYVKPDLPGLEGRLVQQVRREEWRYSDGSWRWRFERRYADRGSDRREVRANASRTYFERADTVSLRDPVSGKRQQFKEEEALIFAAPVKEEKRGFLRSLFRRGGDHEEADEKTWRVATPAEMRQRRNSGEQALRRRGLFG